MGERGTKLKHPTGWFAAGREVSRALPLLSDGAFKVYIYVCLNADRATGRLKIGHANLVKALSKSRRSVIAYLDELRSQQVFDIRSAINQYIGGEIEIHDAFWPYEKESAKDKPTDLAGYTQRVRRLLKSRQCVENSFTPADEKLAASFFRQKVPFEQIERGFLLACARRFVTLVNGKGPGTITSLQYFQNAIDEVGRLQMSADYWRYLQLRVDRLEQQWVAKKRGVAH
jgi:hypothetical protein